MKPQETHWRLTLLNKVSINGKSHWECLCQCGTKHLVRQDCIKDGSIKSCGCLSREMTAARGFKHGLHKSPSYASWNAMMARCYSSDHDSYRHYGGKGIEVCPKWHSPENFIRDMGQRPHKFQIDRIDSNGNYEPNNCRWVSAKDNLNNRSNTLRFSLDGSTMTLKEWAVHIGVKYATLLTRLHRGWPVEKMLSTTNNRGISI